MIFCYKVIVNRSVLIKIFCEVVEAFNIYGGESYQGHLGQDLEALLYTRGVKTNCIFFSGE